MRLGFAVEFLLAQGFFAGASAGSLVRFYAHRMKAAFIFIAVVAVGVSLWLILRAYRQRPNTSARPASPATNVFADLRAKYFVLKRTEVSMPAPTLPTEPWGVIMEIGYPEATVTTVTFADGTASVLRSSGGGFFGGGDESVQSAAKSFLKQARQVQPRMTLTTDFPSPETGHVIFYLRTDGGVYAASAPESELGQQGHPLSEFYHAGLRILHEYLRLQKQQQK